VICIFILLLIIYLFSKQVSVVEKFHDDTANQYHNHVTDNIGYIPCKEQGDTCTSDECCNGLICMNGSCQTSDNICDDDRNYSAWDSNACVDWSCSLGGSNPNSQTRTLNTGIDINCDSHLRRKCTNPCNPLGVVDFEYDLYFETNEDLKIVIKSITTDIELTNLVNSRLYMKLIYDGVIRHSVDNIELTGTINGRKITLSPYIEMLYDFDTNFINFLEGSYKLNLSFDENKDNGFEKNLELNHITGITYTEPNYKQNLITDFTQNVDTNRFIKITGFETRDSLNIMECSMKVRVFKEESGGVDGVSLEKYDADNFVTEKPIRIKSPQATNMVDTEITTTSSYIFGDFYSMTDIVEQDSANPNRYICKGKDKTLYIQLPERKQYRIDFHLVYNGFVLIRRVYTLHIDARGCEDNGQGCGFSRCCANENDICTIDWNSPTQSSYMCKTNDQICANENNFDWAQCSRTCGSSVSSPQTGTLKTGINTTCSYKSRICTSECTPASAIGEIIRIKVEDKNRNNYNKCLHKEGSTNNVGLTNCEGYFCNHRWEIIEAPNGYYQIKYKGYDKSDDQRCRNNIDQCLDYDKGDCDVYENTMCGAFEVYPCDPSKDAQLFRLIDGAKLISTEKTPKTKIRRKGHNYLEYDTGEAGSLNFWGSDGDSEDGSYFQFEKW